MKIYEHQILHNIILSICWRAVISLDDDELDKFNEILKEYYNL
jgi:hypothetical protein